MISLLLTLAATTQDAVYDDFAESSVDIAAPLLAESTQRNSVLSPANIGLTMGMAAITARESDQSAIFRSMNIGTDYAEIRAALQKMSQLEWIKPDDGPESQDAFLTMAFAAYANEGRSLNMTVADRLHQVFKAQTGTVDFSDQPALDRINAWFEEKTEGRVSNLLRSNDLAGTDAFLASALAVKDQWAVPMHALPEPITFTTAERVELEVEGFGTESRLEVITKDTAHFVKIPASNTGSYVVLAYPRVLTKPSQLLQDDALRGVGEWSEQLVNLKVPKWEAETKWELNALVQRLQMHRFELLANAATVPDRWLHWTKFSADEKGFEGAAASVVGMVTSAPTGQPMDITFDRPFAYAVVHIPTQQVLMLGVVDDPSM